MILKIILGKHFLLNFNAFDIKYWKQTKELLKFNLRGSKNINELMIYENALDSFQ